MNGLAERRGELADWSVVALCILAAFAVMRVMADLLAPMIAAVIFGSLLSRVVDRLHKIGLPPPVSAIGLVAITGLTLFIFIDSLLGPITDFVARAPEMLTNLGSALTPVARPFTSAQNGLRALLGGQNGGSMIVSSGLSALTSIFGGAPQAIAELGIFFVTLAFFVAGRQSLRRRMIMTWSDREQRFATLRIVNAVEDSLALYFGSAASIYASVASAVILIAWAAGLAKPVLWGVLTFFACFIPYLGPALVTLSLAAGGLAAHPEIGLGLAPAGGFLIVHLVSDNAIIPALLGHRLEINPFVVFLSIVFWGWMWGPIGALLATPILLIFDTIRQEFTAQETTLPP
ncbi:AI-2E family transporter [Rhodoblastus sp.]|uniref:AI-2E family transporter n=1 Tax=Rhodoblastus sp. TaxID=1962975 RepID=UPI003F9D7EFC